MAIYELAPEAVADLETIQDFVGADNPTAADRLIDEFFEAFEQLERWPALGHTRRDLTRQPVRFWPVGSYLVVYRECPDKVQVVAVLHASRDVSNDSGGPLTSVCGYSAAFLSLLEAER